MAQRNRKSFQESEKTKRLREQLTASFEKDREAYVKHLLSTPVNELNGGDFKMVGFDSDVYELYKLLHDKFYGE